MKNQALIQTATLLSLCGLFLLQSCAATAGRSDPFKLDLPGPTLASRVPSGYELKNRHVRIVIDDKSGQVIYWGLPDGSRNFLGAAPLEVFLGETVAATTEPSTTTAPMGSFEASVADGYIEARDDQTWQYLGEDADHKIGWRRIYCLDGDHLNVSMIVQNRRNVPVEIQLALKGDLSAFSQNRWTSAEVFDAAGEGGSIHLQAYNEYHNVPAQPPFLLLGDSQTLKPDDRVSWTMQWILRPAAARR